MKGSRYRVEGLHFNERADFNTLKDANAYAAMKARRNCGVSQKLYKFNSTTHEYERVKGWKYEN